MKKVEVFVNHTDPKFRKMKVESGYLYNFWDYTNEKYLDEWVFVPNESN